MFLDTYRIKNFRRFKDVYINLSNNKNSDNESVKDNISIFVGSNNSGKTSATQALMMFLSGEKSKFSLFDFNSSIWKELDEIGNKSSEGDNEITLPSIILDLWFDIKEEDLYLIIPLLPSLSWRDSKIGLRIEFCSQNSANTLKNYREERKKSEDIEKQYNDTDRNYSPWPSSLTDYLKKKLTEEFELRYYVLDYAYFNEDYTEKDEYKPLLLNGELKGGAYINSLIRIDCLNAQRHLSDPSSKKQDSGRAEDLSKRLSRFYQRNLEQLEQSHDVLSALYYSENELNKHLQEVFEGTLNSLSRLGYPGIYNPELEIKSALNPASIMSQDARVHYKIDGSSISLPDTYNGLGLKNLIYMVVEILDFHETWQKQENKPLIHLIIIEEPEAHLHTQLQQVFIEKVLNLVESIGNDKSRSQMIVTTHSPHILYKSDFKSIRYFKRNINKGIGQTTSVLNLSDLPKKLPPKDIKFLEKYIKLTHCDLFFSDAAILVEGNVERLLLPIMIEKVAPTLNSSALCILEVGGAFGHRFKELIYFLGINTLIITDLDSVIGTYNNSCPTTEIGAKTSNPTLKEWLPKKDKISDLLEATEDEKEGYIDGGNGAKVRVAYQVGTELIINGKSETLCGRTLEESFGIENFNWCQNGDGKDVGLKLETEPNCGEDIVKELHNTVKSKSFDKTNFALQIMYCDDKWVVPKYIKEGLEWLDEIMQNNKGVKDTSLESQKITEVVEA